MAEQTRAGSQNPIAILRDDLSKMEGQFKAALPAHIPVERFARVVMTAIQNNPDLLKCTRQSLWNSSMKAAQDGLLPDSREGALVAYGNEAQWMPMIAGIRKKVRNSGEIATWDVHVVHQNDKFAFELGDEPFIKHIPKLDGEPGAVICAYSIATLKTGEKSRDVMSIAAIEKVRTRSRAKKGGPWFTDYDEMCKKTVARRHSKVLPMSTDLDDLLRRDDDLYDMKEAKDEAPERLKTLSGRLDQLARSQNQVTGEVIELTPNGIEPPSGQQGAASPSHPGPATDGKPAPTEGQPTSEPKAGAGREPTTEMEYAAFLHAWLAKANDPTEIGKRWNREGDLRERCGVVGEGYEVLADEVSAKVKALRGKK